MHEAIGTTQTAINQLGAAITLPEFVHHADRLEVRDYAVRVAIAVQTRKTEIDAQLETALVNWKLSRLGRIERDILRVAVAEMDILSSVPQRVAINEAIELAKKYGDEDTASFLNGVLRRVVSSSRERAPLETPSSAT
ncbi:MAG: transcription antitermination factor NusB [Cyanobacteria bacterium J06639_1]